VHHPGVGRIQQLQQHRELSNNLGLAAWVGPKTLVMIFISESNFSSNFFKTFLDISPVPIQSKQTKSNPSKALRHFYIIHFTTRHIDIQQKYFW
jgi:hypothetical protein